MNKGPSVQAVQSLLSTKEKKVATAKAKFTIHRTAGGKYAWILSVRGKPVARSASDFSSASHARRNAESVSKHAATAEVADGK